MTFIPRSQFPTDRSGNFLYFEGLRGTGQGIPLGDVFYFDVPEWANFLDVKLVGAGGDGGNGFSRTAGSAGGGGGGGGCGAICTGILNANKLPRRLGLNINGGGSNGGTSLFIPESTSIITSSSFIGINFIMYATAAASGGNGTGTAAGGGGGAAGVSLIASMPMFYGCGSNFQTLAGTAGSAGGSQAGANAGNITAFVSSGLCVSSGSGGAGCTSTDFNGGAVNAASSITQTSIAATGAGTNGQDGTISKYGIYRLGGGGGASNNNGVGGRGGNGAPGCGAGGGGAGTTGGTGGQGGPGFAEITFF